MFFQKFSNYGYFIRTMMLGYDFSIVLLFVKFSFSQLKHEKGNQDLASRRIAFEEEICNDAETVESFTDEAESLRNCLRKQVSLVNSEN